jgi:hypothetical protein
MHLSALAHIPLAVQVTAAVIGVAALSAGSVWLTRAATRYVTGRGGQNWETVLLLAFFAAAAAQSAGGLLGFARHNMHLVLPMAVVFWLALDGAAGMLLSMVRRRARAGRSIWHVRLVVWAIIAASSSFNWIHAPHSPGAALAFASMPVIAGVLAELAVADIKQEEAEKARRLAGGRKVSRRIELVRWLHPLELIRVTSVMAADAGLSAEDATREVRADTAARAVYRLRLAMPAEGDESTISRIRVRVAELRAQAALRRAGFATAETPEDILRRVQILVRTRDFAVLDYGTAEAAKETIDALIPGEKPDTPPVAVSPIAAPLNRDGKTVVSITSLSDKEAKAHEWLSEQRASGVNWDDITGTQVNKAAGWAENSSSGRTAKNKFIAEMEKSEAAARQAADTADGTVTG